MANTKDERIYIRVSGEIRDDFDKVAEFRGLTRSGLLHSLIVKTIHETKKDVPEIFEDSPRKSKNNESAITLDEAKADDSKKRGKKK